DGGSPAISLLQPFTFFGTTYDQVYVNNNGHLTFDQAWYSYSPYQFPANGGRDIIAPFWTDIDNRGNGVISYQQYSSGDVLTQATQDINQYFPQIHFSATWVFVATWDRVAYYSYSGTETSFQVVLISDGQLSFVLMNYGHIATTGRGIIKLLNFDSSYYFSIPGSFQYNYNNDFTYTSNVNVTGRWAFRVDHGSRTCQFNGNVTSSQRKQYLLLRIGISAIVTLLNVSHVTFSQATLYLREPVSGQIPHAGRDAPALAGVSSAAHSLAHTLKPAGLPPWRTPAKMFNAKPAPSLETLTTTPLTIRSSTFRGPAPMSCRRYTNIYFIGVEFVVGI
uniref:NIDO domain-containing protein n=1 Tax=Astyanax mexicanus TaxID=7994 RepID=W5KKC9_ASTMX